MENIQVLVAVGTFAALMLLLYRLGRQELSLSIRVLSGLALGAAFGTALQTIMGHGAPVIADTLEWTGIVGSGYVNLLKMIVMPLVLVSMVSAVVRMDEIAALGKIGGMVVGILVATTVVAALVGAFIAAGFGLRADGLTEGAREMARAEVLVTRQETLTSLSIADMLVRFIPKNIFEDLAGLRPTSIIAVVIFGILLGIAGLMVTRDNPEQGARFRSFTETAQTIVMQLVRMVIALTPYGVLALMTKVAATSSADDILNLVGFIIASYIAIAIMFAVHGGILLVTGTNAFSFFKRVFPVLLFAFTSRSSAATIPLNIETQTKSLGNDPTIASISASFGATIGQNGCAGIYPAMLAVMIAPSMGVNPLDPTFLATMVGIVAISSFGVAGVGGGATFAALMVLPALGFPVALVALLISIEPLIDMARTALNVSGAMTAGTVTAKLLGRQSDINEPEPQTA